MSKKPILKYVNPVYSPELNTDENRKKFDALPEWQRHLIKRIIDHGDLARAAKECNVSTEVKSAIDLRKTQGLTVEQAAEEAGLSLVDMLRYLKEVIEADATKFNSRGDPIRVIDLNVRAKGLDILCKILGLYDRKKEADTSNKGLINLFKDTNVGEDEATKNSRES